MFYLEIYKNILLKPLFIITNIVNKKNVNININNILIILKQSKILLITTNIDIEIIAYIQLNNIKYSSIHNKIAIPAKKFLDIIKSVNIHDKIIIKLEPNNFISIKSGNSKFLLSTCSVDEFPVFEKILYDVCIIINREDFIHFLNLTYFSISKYDPRIYLNSILFELNKDFITLVSTDGYRISIYRSTNYCSNNNCKFLLPKKSIQEIIKILNNIEENKIKICINKIYFSLYTENFVLKSKLIISDYPDYEKIIPKKYNLIIIIKREILKKAISRIIILANEQSRSIILKIKNEFLVLFSQNQEQEKSIEYIKISYKKGHEIDIGINANYLLDVLDIIPGNLIKFSLLNNNSGILIESIIEKNYKYLVMPIKT